MAIDTAIALTSLDEAKQFLKIATVSTEDDIVGDIINSVSDWINRFCNRTFLSGERTEYYDGTGTNQLMLRNLPVTAVTLLRDDDLRVWGTQVITIATQVIIDGGPGILKLWNGAEHFTKGTLNVKVTYTSGYALASIPYTVQLACKELVSLVYRNTYSQWRLGIASEQIGERTITFRDEEMPKLIKSLLAPYRVFAA